MNSDDFEGGTAEPKIFSASAENLLRAPKVRPTGQWGRGGRPASGWPLTSVEGAGIIRMILKVIFN